ncbi:MAG TPA: pyridoxal-phosphate dependent enzyme [Solirubrobacterales bacterium]|nr:pyridoxal-phosphate dependent enzyme [Solirubrobacterales bacterium]
MASVTDTISLDEIRSAREVVADVARETQVIESRYLSRTTGGTIALKAENLQRTGSFKLRGALNKIASLDPSVKGVVTASAGNHGQSLAYGARARGLTATIFMPERAALAKIAAAEESGADVVLEGDSVEPCVEAARERADAEGLAFVHPFDDPAIVAGQGTVGLELLEEVPDLAKVLIPVGGGGLAAGIAAAVKAARDDVRVAGIKAQCPLADGIAVKHPGEITAPLLEHLLDELVTVDQDAIADAIMMLLERTKLVVEGAGAVGVAALRQQLVDPAEAGTTVVVLSGGNIDTGVLADLARHHETERGRRLRIFTKIPDEPGSLGALLTSLGDGGANLIDVDHVREAVGLSVGETGVELVMETRGPEHAKQLLGQLEKLGYKPSVLS